MGSSKPETERPPAPEEMTLTGSIAANPPTAQEIACQEWCLENGKYMVGLAKEAHKAMKHQYTGGDLASNKDKRDLENFDKLYTWNGSDGKPDGRNVRQWETAHWMWYLRAVPREDKDAAFVNYISEDGTMLFCMNNKQGSNPNRHMSFSAHMNVMLAKVYGNVQRIRKNPHDSTPNNPPKWSAVGKLHSVANKTITNNGWLAACKVLYWKAHQLKKPIKDYDSDSWLAGHLGEGKEHDFARECFYTMAGTQNALMFQWLLIDYPEKFEDDHSIKLVQFGLKAREMWQFRKDPKDDEKTAGPSKGSIAGSSKPPAADPSKRKNA